MHTLCNSVLILILLLPLHVPGIIYAGVAIGIIVVLLLMVIIILMVIGLIRKNRRRKGRDTQDNYPNPMYYNHQHGKRILTKIGT